MNRCLQLIQQAAITAGSHCTSVWCVAFDVCAYLIAQAYCIARIIIMHALLLYVCVYKCMCVSISSPHNLKNVRQMQNAIVKSDFHF